MKKIFIFIMIFLSSHTISFCQSTEDYEINLKNFSNWTSSLIRIDTNKDTYHVIYRDNKKPPFEFDIYNIYPECNKNATVLHLRLFGTNFFEYHRRNLKNGVLAIDNNVISCTYDVHTYNDGIYNIIIYPSIDRGYIIEMMMRGSKMVLDFPLAMIDFYINLTGFTSAYNRSAKMCRR